MEEGEAPGAGGGKLGIVDEDVLNSQSYVATGTHWSRPTGHVIPMSQLHVFKTESSKNYLPASASIKRRELGDGDSFRC